MGTTDEQRPDPTTDPTGAASAAAAAIADATGVSSHSVAIVLGSGWQAAAEPFGTPTATLRMADLPGFAAPSASGHSGTITSVNVGGTHTLLLQGRTHAYEGHDLRRVVHPVRSAIATGVKTVVLTNAAGGIREGMSVGQPVLISDHLNLTARSPLVGAEFVDLVDAYSSDLRDLAREIDPSLEDGVYAGLPGPHYETPAEIRMLRTLGADLVGMSTVHETIAARAQGARVLGISLVTNLAAGMTGEHLNHAEVLEAGKASASRMGDLLHRLVTSL
ncbi:purine-nucleoside phosphorylase [Rhodococcus sp. BP-252]|uniref:Purine nucleoside phosphorylase n=1 Tax=Rhodococcoides kyotonense TaxID=398843 RepID=A0A177Y800_9NOCA|nr:MULTISPECIES: purine-nucleoside phosphorylase [Rhodococcus]MBY6413842.1 purine-nucleoside phosphorylase [Rhodococcus sp. BP-320]MBY6419262.1 purine-nucleoside phosphorylase [Rhodococcus sp. BP-321]MBY6424087.1 purine-nucleoside phosphorylase [Rhodococcus sp. BP-324]MBY6428585.1 purine-nucleoside phosphorylase [Rhodococcus sp. BP-323]MBY6434337.1 purine-nucleoside phosphorylase [Rhodococcus sp. BP-322]